MQTKKGAEAPRKFEVGYADWIMSQFRDDEVFNGYPKANGLRRLVGELIGEIVYSVSTVKQFPCPENQFRATVEHVIRVITPNGLEITFGRSADTYAGNMDVKASKFAIHPVAVCETKAESRTMRFLLGIDTMSADEVVLNPGVAEQVVVRIDPEAITDSQVNAITKVAKLAKADLNKFLSEEGYTDIKEVGKGSAPALIKMLSEYHRLQNTPASIKVS
jgi:hypothetical protein